ncbi:hypothetical protein Ddye_005142 [Dipteronia dyeriana]|uniref:Uncharacterized protein n=1 Tax=Dipteronia dyeriana TaxID=168575 RepID=A0AAD9XFQ2_9ROSI|nr:hypothetical protein Ddye_005142 [Dipteronia dyeriana]
MSLISLSLAIQETRFSSQQKGKMKFTPSFRSLNSCLEKSLEIMPLEWITNYEKTFQNTTLVIASDTKYVKQKDGSIKTVYETITESKGSSSTPPVFQALMIRPVISEDGIPIHSFQPDGSPVYTDKIKGHLIWDVDPNMCDADCECRTCLRDYKTPCKSFHKPSRPDDPNSP